VTKYNTNLWHGKRRAGKLASNIANSGSDHSAVDRTFPGESLNLLYYYVCIDEIFDLATGRSVRQPLHSGTRCDGIVIIIIIIIVIVIKTDERPEEKGENIEKKNKKSRQKWTSNVYGSRDVSRPLPEAAPHVLPQQPSHGLRLMNSVRTVSALHGWVPRWVRGVHVVCVAQTTPPEQWRRCLKPYAIFTRIRGGVNGVAVGGGWADRGWKLLWLFSSTRSRSTFFVFSRSISRFVGAYYVIYIYIYIISSCTTLCMYLYHIFTTPPQ